MCCHYTIHRNVQTYAAGFEPASLFLPEEKLSKNCCKFPYFSYVLFVTTPSLELGNSSPLRRGLPQNLSVPACGVNALEHHLIFLLYQKSKIRKTSSCGGTWTRTKIDGLTVRSNKPLYDTPVLCWTYRGIRTTQMTSAHK